MLKTVFDSLSTNLSEWIVYGAIAVVTLIGLFQCILPVFRNARLLNRAVIKLEQSTMEGQAPAWREPRFLGKALRNEWKQFLQNAGQLDLRGIPCDTSDYINEETVIERPGHSQLADLIPGLLTSLGILGTFMGLMQGLTSVDFTTATGTMDSIPVLLTGMKFAFATSVAGISCSLCFNMLNRIAIGKAARALDSFEDSFYELAMPRPLQSDVQLLCQKQDEEARVARVMNTLGSQISASIESAVGRAMQPLSRSLDEFIRGATQEQVEGIRRIAGQFVYQMNNSLSDQFRDLSSTMNEVNQAQMKTQHNIDASVLTIEALNARAESIAAACAETAKLMNDMNRSLAEDRQRRVMDAEAAQYSAEELAGRMRAAAESLGRLKEAADEAAARLKEQAGGDK